MTIKEATREMLWNIERRHTRTCNENGIRGYDRDIAEMLCITPVTYSRLRKGLTSPRILTWYKITELHKTLVGVGATENIINQIS